MDHWFCQICWIQVLKVLSHLKKNSVVITKQGKNNKNILLFRVRSQEYNLLEKLSTCIESSEKMYWELWQILCVSHGKSLLIRRKSIERLHYEAGTNQPGLMTGDFSNTLDVVHMDRFFNIKLCCHMLKIWFLTFVGNIIQICTARYLLNLYAYDFLTNANILW